MTYLDDKEKLSDYDLGKKIYERPNGSALYFAKSKKGNHANCIIRTRSNKDAVSKLMFKFEKSAFKSPSRLKPFSLPIISVFTEKDVNYTVYKNPIGEKVDKLMSNVKVGKNASESVLKDLSTQYMTFNNRLKKLNLFPIEDSSVDNMILDENGKIHFIGFESVVPSVKDIQVAIKQGIKSEVLTIAKNAIGEKTSFLKAANFVHYLYTNKNAITEKGLKILKGQFSNDDVLDLVNLCATKSLEQLKKFNPFTSKYLKHRPKVECGETYFKIDALSVNWEDEINVSLGEFTMALNTSEMSFTISQGNSQIKIDSSGLELKSKSGADGEEEEEEEEEEFSILKLGADGLTLENGDGEVNISDGGLESKTERGNMTINDEGLQFESDGGNLTIGEDVSCTIHDFKFRFGKKFSVKSSLISVGLNTKQVDIELLNTINVSVKKEPSVEISAFGTSLTLGGESPFSLDIGNNISFNFKDKKANLNVGGIDISCEGGNVCIDNEVVSVSMGKDGFNFETFGVPFDLKSIKENVGFPKFKFNFPNLKLPKLPKLPKRPKPKEGEEEEEEGEEDNNEEEDNKEEEDKDEEGKEEEDKDEEGNDEEDKDEEGNDEGGDDDAGDGDAGDEAEAPEAEEPEVEEPEIEEPEIEAPEIEAPEIEAPDVEAPDGEAPDVEVPDVGGCCNIY